MQQYFKITTHIPTTQQKKILKSSIQIKQPQLSVYITNIDNLYNIQKMQNQLKITQQKQQVIKSNKTLPLVQQIRKTRKERVRWSNIEDLKYYLFLFHNKKRFLQSDIRRSFRMFKQRAYFIKSRDANQCRVRHLKLVRKYQTIQGNLQNYITCHPQFAEKYNKVKKYLEVLEDNLYFGDFQLYDNHDEQQDKLKGQEKLNKFIKVQEPTSEQNKNIQTKIPIHESNQIKQEEYQVQQQWISYYYFDNAPGLLIQPIFYI